MKQLYYVLLISFITSVTIQAQTPLQTVDLFNSNTYYAMNGVYYKDTQGYFNQYVGTWLYTNGTTSLKITFQKKYFTQQSTGTFYTDDLIGEYEYKVNGATVFNTLNNLNISHTSPYDYNLFSSRRVPNDGCYQCTVPEQRLVMRYDEPTNDNEMLDGTFIMHTINENGQVKLYVKLNTNNNNGLNWSKTNPDLPANTTQLTLPEGIYIFNKVN